MNTYHRMRSMAPFGLLLALLLTAEPVQAQSEPKSLSRSATPTCVTLADGTPYYLAAADRLAHAIPEQPGKAPGAWVFHRDAVFTRPHQPGQRILLSGSETGSGFVTDDILMLETIPLYQERSWDFRSADRMRIIPRRSPADITDLFLPEQFNMVTVTMQDVLGPVFRSSDLWLLTYSPCDWLIATPTATHTPMPTHTAVPTVCTETPTMTPTATSMPTLMRTNVPTAVSTPERAISKAGSTPTAESVPSLPTATPLPPQASADADAPTMMTHQHIRIALLALLLSGSLLALYGWQVFKAYVPLPRWRNWRKQVGHYLRTMRMRWRMVRSFIDKQMKP